MVNVTSICDRLRQINTANEPLTQRLSAMLELLQRETGLRGYFCQIWGKRWSYVAGDITLAFAPVRRQLSPRYGIFYEQNSNIDDKLMEEILQTIKQILMETENE